MRTTTKCSVLWLALGMVILLITAPGCATSKGKQTESYLTAAGFRQLPATNATQERQVRRLPPGQLSLVKRKGQVYYVYPDRAKNLLFVGQKAQYENFQNLLGDAEAASDYQLTHVWQDGGVNPIFSDGNSTPGFDDLGGFDF